VVALLHGGIRQHHHHFCHRRDGFPGRMVISGTRNRGFVDRRERPIHSALFGRVHAGHARRFLDQGPGSHLRRNVDSLDTAKIPVRPAHGSRLEVADPRFAGEHPDHGTGVPPGDATGSGWTGTAWFLAVNVATFAVAAWLLAKLNRTVWSTDLDAMRLAEAQLRASRLATAEERGAR
jgi:hypothetical protein